MNIAPVLVVPCEQKPQCHRSLQKGLFIKTARKNGIPADCVMFLTCWPSICLSVSWLLFKILDNIQPTIKTGWPAEYLNLT